MSHLANFGSKEFKTILLSQQRRFSSIILGLALVHYCHGRVLEEGLKLDGLARDSKIWPHSAVFGVPFLREFEKIDDQ